MKRLFILFLFAFTITFAGHAQISSAQAMFLYNFSRLIKWPESNSQGDFVFGVFGNKDVYNNLVTLTKGKMVGTQPIAVKYFNDTREISACHVIFVSNTKLSQFHEVVRRMQNNSSLIVTEKQGMISSGSTIDFVVADNKLHYMLSEENARKNNLVVSRNLQDMAMTN
ncbi:MAG: YfiR family protein [Bacteroidales bacterium]|nr:YfiR family protein [Bacteroidales bacterium]MBN2764435.1 YfiR family protein [Bacteroidales bacterium]